ncbi:phage head-tail connector protein [Paraburkholderia sp. BR14374]|uniref:head-tail connector protein n=1 Tax=Paraburkholderia sp. BR14374 TaxID=3237007 RepID=UPI0034CF7DBE
MPEILLQRPVGEPVDLAEAKLHLRVTDDAQDSLIATLVMTARIAAETITRQQLLHARYQLVLDRFPMAGVGTPLPFEHVINYPAFAIVLPHAPLVDVVSINYLDMNGTPQTMDPADYVVNSALMPAIITPGFGKIWAIPLPQIGAVTVTYDAGYMSVCTISGSLPSTQIQVRGPVTWAVGNTVRFFNSGGALPTPLQVEVPYTVTAANAGLYALQDPGGNPVTLSDAGSGTSYVYGGPEPVPEGIRNWILLRTGSLYENREEVAILNRGKVEELPFVAGLLDPYRMSLP